MALGTYPAVNRAFFDVDVEIRGNAGQRDRVAKRDQFAGPLCGLDCGDPGDAQNIPFFLPSLTGSASGFPAS
jgi:hypothetical protein